MKNERVRTSGARGLLGRGLGRGKLGIARRELLILSMLRRGDKDRVATRSVCSLMSRSCPRVKLTAMCEALRLL